MTDLASPPTRRTYAIKVIGVGGAGGNALSHLAPLSLPGVDFAALNTDVAALEHCQAPTKITIGSKSSRGLGAGGDPARGRQAAQEDYPLIQSLCQNADIVFVIAGLGGGTGTGAGPVVAQAAKEAGALVLSIVMLPFECEGARRNRQAQEGLLQLKERSDGVICLPNQKVFKLIDEKTSLLEAFRITNEFVTQGVQGIWRVLSQPGLINVDFADLRSVTQGKHASSALVSVEAKGEHRVREVLEKLHRHPLFDDGHLLGQASAMLVCIAGGPELAMKDVQRIMDNLRQQDDPAHVIMGASIDPHLTDRLSLTLVASCLESSTPASPSNPPAPTPPAPPSDSDDTPATQGELADHLVELGGPQKASGRYVPPAPELDPDQARQIFLERAQGSSRKKVAHRMRQGQLPLDIISKGRFEKSEPTLHRGEDLDVPTYVRRGVPLN